MTPIEFVESEQDLDVLVEDESEEDDLGLFETAASSLPYFGADFDIAGLVRRLGEGDIVIPRFDPDESTGLTVEGFQRQRVWTTPRMEKFIESLLLGWPVPSIFLVVEPDGRYLVLDGQQRLTTLQSFYEGTQPDGRPFVLRDVAEHLQGATFETLTQESKRRLNNTFIQAVVIEPAGDDGRDSVYRLFGRLNSGGVSLTPQEIRVALYRGPLVDLIRDLNHDPAWRLLFGAIHKKLKDHELILRALAMSDVLTRLGGAWDDQARRALAYKPPMAQFLNNYLERNSDISNSSREKLASSFGQASALLVEAFGRDGLKLSGRLNAAHIDAIMGVLLFALMRNINVSPDRIKSAVAQLRADPEYVILVSRSTSHSDSVFGRLQFAYQAIVDEPV